jgi:hypothetical protein
MLDSKMSKEEEHVSAHVRRSIISAQLPKATEAGGKVTAICPDCHEKVRNALTEEQ